MIPEFAAGRARGRGDGDRRHWRDRAGRGDGAVGGRRDVRERGELQWLESGELLRCDLEIGALNEEASIGQFEARVSWLATTGSERSES